MVSAQDESDSFATLGERIERFCGDDFVGRSFELRFFESYLARLPERTERIVNVHGIGGIGKTVLLERFRTIAIERNAHFVHVDLRQAAGNAVHIAAIVDAQARPPAARNGLARTAAPNTNDAEPWHTHAEAEADASRSPERCAAALNRIAAVRTVVLAFDHYEEAGSLDAWLRESFLPSLHTNMLVVIAGRFPLEGPWRLSPAWRKLVVALPLCEWSYEDAKSYLERCGLASDGLATDQLWIRTFGHPLSMALTVSAFPASARVASGLAASLPERLDERFEELVRHWLREVPDDDLHELVMAASVTRSFRQESLSAMVGRAIPSSIFDRLVRLSFVERNPSGWRMHELARETVRRSFRERYPDRFEQYRRTAVLALRERIAAAIEAARDIARESAELLGHTGNPILRAHFRHSRASRNYWETVGPHNAAEAEAYVRRRISGARDSVIRCSDPETGELFRFSLDAAQSLLQLTPVSVRELVRHGGDGALRLLRSPEGDAVGLVAIVPIHEGTLPFLRNAPVSRAYFRTLTADQAEAFQVRQQESRASFLFYADVADPEKEELRSDVVRLKLEHILSGVLLVASPPHLPYYAEAHRSLGFIQAAGAEHADYGEAAPFAPTYLLDTRGNGMVSYLSRVTEHSDGLPAAMEHITSIPTSAFTTENRYPPLTPRELEVAGLLAQGHTNAEIAAALYMSVAAVKKHVNAMLHKYGLKNRTQLAKALPV